MRVLVTGSAGFIGFQLAGRLIADGVEVHGVDGLIARLQPWNIHARRYRCVLRMVS
jgi:nucleoside-diphosphate-sugar epimerase